MGLWPKRCVAGTARLDFAGVTRGRRGWPPAALSQDRCVLGPYGRPVVAAFGQARPRGQRRIAFRASRRCACRRIAPARASRGCRRAGGRRRPRYASCHMHLPRLHAPEPRTGAPVLASVRRFSGVARTGRSNDAARGGAGLVARIIAETGGVWQRLRGGAAGTARTPGVRAPAMSGGAEHPHNSGGARHAIELTRWSRTAVCCCCPLGALSALRCGQAERARRQRS